MRSGTTIRASRPPTSSETMETSCPVYPLFFYSFASLLEWDGDIVVQE